MARTRYAIGIGSNRRGRHGAPADEVRAAMAALKGRVAASRVVASAPLGPSTRRFANAVAIVETGAKPAKLLKRLQRIERDFGRRRGRRWGARVIDLDILLWSAGLWVSPTLAIPHPSFRARDFVLRPLAMLVPGWRDPVTNLSVRQLHVRLTAPRPVPSRIAVGP